MKVCFLWHMHQPYYKDLLTGVYEMPWVRLHGTKDYYDMVAILDDFPNIRQTFNLVPSLLEQIEEYAGGKAIDNHLALSLKPTAQLTEEDKAVMIVDFFKANYDTMIAPYPRYKRLFDLKNTGMNSFTSQDWLDLQVWSNLAWIDPYFDKAELISYLKHKHRDFTEDDKAKLLEFQRDLMGKIIPKYKEVAERGQVELSVTPYYHPILPLLCDTEVARQSVAQISLPDSRFSFPEDAREHIEMAVSYFEAKFGFKPKGMWPSEGSVSESIIPFIADSGIEWIATDEEILALSLGNGVRGEGDNSLINGGGLYKPYKYDSGEHSIKIFFRDHAVSDLIGFVYSRMEPEKAASDFMSKLEAIEANLLRKGKPDGVVSVILDGENAWEYFPEDGGKFLKELYMRLSEHSSIKTATFSEACSDDAHMGSLNKIHPGSWINHDFGIWIGHPEDNKAWDLLYDARIAYSEVVDGKNSLSKESLAIAKKELMIAEGSDWCWWFGDDHHSPDNSRFDSLYRSHLANVYKSLKLDVPPELYKPIRTDYIRAHLNDPVDFIKPIIDGRITHFYEWSNAGMFDCQKAGSTMHKAERILRSIYYGYGKRGEIFIRIDPLNENYLKRLKFVLKFEEPKDFVITIVSGRATSNHDVQNLKTGIENILEIGFINSMIQGDKSALVVSVMENGDEIERWPAIDSIPIRPDLAESQFWMV